MAMLVLARRGWRRRAEHQGPVKTLVIETSESSVRVYESVAPLIASRPCISTANIEALAHGANLSLESAEGARKEHSHPVENIRFHRLFVMRGSGDLA